MDQYFVDFPYNYQTTPFVQYLYEYGISARVDILNSTNSVVFSVSNLVTDIRALVKDFSGEVVMVREIKK